MMATSEIICNASNYVYYNNRNNYRSTNSNTMYIGTSDTSGTSGGDFRGYFCIDNPYALDFKHSLAKVASISFQISTYKSSSGYNDCTARLDFVGTGWDNGNATEWRFGGESATIYLREGSITTLTATDSETLIKFRDMILSAASGEKVWFRLFRVSGQGAVIKASCKFVITYDATLSPEETIEPTLNGYQIIDKAVGLDGKHSLYEHFGVAIQNESQLSIQFDYGLDPAYPTLLPHFTLEIYDASNKICQLHHGDSSATASVEYDYIGTEDGVPKFASQKSYSVSNPGLFHLNPLLNIGTYKFKAVLNDTVSDSAPLEGTFSVVSYKRPSIDQINVERYTIITATDTDDPEYVATDDGSLVRFDIRADASPINGIGADGSLIPNATTVTISYGQDDEISDTVVVFEEISGNGVSIRVSSSEESGRQVLPNEFTAAFAWNFTLTISDYIGLQSKIVYIDRATADFNIESFGVSVGMRTQGNPSEKLFEVAPEYEARFYGGIRGVTNYRADETETGGRWIDGRMIYRRVVEIKVDALNTRANAADEFSEPIEIISMNGYVIRGEGPYRFPLSWYAASNNYHILWMETETQLTAMTTAALTGYAILEYVKKEV